MRPSPSAGWSRRTFLGASAGAAGTLATMAVLDPAFAAINYAKPAGWEKLVAAANQEGSLNIYGTPGDLFYAAYVKRFEQAFPKIHVEGSFLPSPEAQTRVLAERSAHRYIPDVWINGSTTALRGLKPVGALAPLETYLILPEILDPAAWFQNALWWNDAKRPYTDLSFTGLMYPPAYVNTQLVNLNQIHSYWDLADPKFRGKVVSNDIRLPGQGGVPARFIYTSPKLGPPWFERFFGSLEVVMSRDQRQMVDWLAQGRYAMAAFIGTDEALIAQQQGLPIAPIQLSQLREGGAIAPGGGTVAVMNPTPHPNAAKLYVNWLLSRDGQRALQEETQSPSLRIDLPKAGIPLAFPENSRVRFVNGGLEEYSAITGDVLAGLLNDILKKAGRA